MLVHTVLFNLVPNLSAEEVASFEADARSLAGIPGLRGFYFGKPAATERRPVVQVDYDYMLTVVVDDVAGHDTYQDHPIHHAFVAKQKARFARVRVFDAD